MYRNHAFDFNRQLSLQDLKWGIFAPTLSHVIDKTTVVGSRVDGSDPTMRLGSFTNKPSHFIKINMQANPNLGNFMESTSSFEECKEGRQ
jgi:hypothetical protein